MPPDISRACVNQNLRDGTGIGRHNSVIRAGQIMPARQQLQGTHERKFIQAFNGTCYAGSQGGLCMRETTVRMSCVMLSRHRPVNASKLNSGMLRPKTVQLT